MPLEGLSRPQVMDALKRAFKGQELDLSRAGDGDDGQPQHIGELAREMKKELKKVGGELPASTAAASTAAAANNSRGTTL